MKMLTVVGARPQFIKAAVVSRAIAEHNARGRNRHIDGVIVHTGQHYDANMSVVFFEQMRIPRAQYNLGIQSGSHGAMTGQMMEAIEKVLEKERPDAVLVYGDTNSTLAAALAAAKLHIPIAHVEAGLRSFNRRMPEEINRVMTDGLSEWLFCPTETAVHNLAAEGFGSARSLSHCRVRLVGDVMYDAARFYRQLAEASHETRRAIEECGGRFALATVHRAENTNDRSRLRGILGGLGRVAAELPILFPVHPRTRKILTDEAVMPAGVHMIDPVGYFDMLVLLDRCTAVFTDSGGVQKEAFFFRRPCITLRDETEWIELLEAGANRLAGADPQRIVEAWRDAVSAAPSWDAPLYGDGDAGGRIVRELVET